MSGTVESDELKQNRGIPDMTAYEIECENERLSDIAMNQEMEADRITASFVEFMSFEDMSQAMQDAKAYVEFDNPTDPYLVAKAKICAALNAHYSAHGSELKEDRARRAENVYAAIIQMFKHIGEYA